MILYINCCVRENSRTDRLARAVLGKLGGEYEELYLPDENLQPLSRELLDRRTALIENGDYSDDIFRYAKQFAAADKIVVSAPFWDFSFPSVLKVYIENIYAVGIVSRYTPEGVPYGLCRADELIYVTTAGGPYVPDYSFCYIKELCETCFGIPRITLVKAEMLDVDGFDAERIIEDKINEINRGTAL